MTVLVGQKVKFVEDVLISNKEDFIGAGPYQTGGILVEGILVDTATKKQKQFMWNKLRSLEFINDQNEIYIPAGTVATITADSYNGYGTVDFGNGIEIEMFIANFVEHPADEEKEETQVEFLGV